MKHNAHKLVKFSGRGYWGDIVTQSGESGWDAFCRHYEEAKRRGELKPRPDHGKVKYND